MLIVYTGEGKGKTSASVGQLLRAYGQGMSLAFGQFMKRDGQAGEQKVIADLLGQARYKVNGCGFYRDESEKEKHRQAALELIGWAMALLPELDMLVLDEALYALGSGLITEEELRDLIAACRKADVHLVISGRGVPDWLRVDADLVTEMLCLKHHYNSGHKAQKGIEF